jgi:hypothetical protein
MGWKVSRDKRPEVFGNKCLGHRISPSMITDAILVPELSLRTSAVDQSGRLPSKIRPETDIRALRACYGLGPAPLLTTPATA